MISAQIGTQTHRHVISMLLAVAAMSLLLIHVADGSIERISKHGFLPVSVDKWPFGLSNFGISSIILFFLASGIVVSEKKAGKKNKITTTLLIAGGALIGTTALMVSVMEQSGSAAPTVTVSVLGFAILGLALIPRSRA